MIERNGKATDTYVEPMKMERAECRGRLANSITVRPIFIVSRDHPWLHADLADRFHDDPNVRVILDRRVRERRVSSAAMPPFQEQRRGERRRPVPAGDDLRVRSHYIVELE
jgi:hypothetical protein